MPTIRVLLPSESPEGRLRWYTDGIGLAVERSWDEPHNRGWLLKVSESGYVEIIAANDRYPAGSAGATQIVIQVDDVDAVTARVASLDSEVVSRPADMVWGTRAAQVRDPEGTIVNLFGPLTG